MKALLKSSRLDWAPGKLSKWMTKDTLYKLAGTPYEESLGPENGPRIFWIHLRVLSQSGYLPRFTSKSKNNKLNGKTMCMTNDGIVTDVWCKKCNAKKVDPSFKCRRCLPVIHFKRNKKSKVCLNARLREQSFYTNVREAFCTKLEELAPSPMAIRCDFKGLDFTKLLLPSILDPSRDIENFNIPNSLRSALFSKEARTLPVMTRLHRILTSMYGTRVAKKPCLWIAPVANANACVCLNNKITLTASSTYNKNLRGAQHLWGFNSADVRKWHTIQAGDIVLFGSTSKQGGFHKMGIVQEKFVWRDDTPLRVFVEQPNMRATMEQKEEGEEEDSKLMTWLYGYTVRLQTIKLDGEVLFDLCNKSYFQTQTRLHGEIAQKVFEHLSELSVELPPKITESQTLLKKIVAFEDIAKPKKPLNKVTFINKKD